MSALSPRQMFVLDLACKPIVEAFGFGSLYLVGTAAKRETYRDVDVRCILTDEEYDRIQDALGFDALTFLALAVGQYLASLTGLPIDFQFQRRTEANERHNGLRNPLGSRSLSNFQGDARPNREEQH